MAYCRFLDDSFRGDVAEMERRGFRPEEVLSMIDRVRKEKS